MKKLSWLILLFSVSVLFGQYDSWNVDFISSISTSTCYTAFTFENLCCVGSGNSLLIFDITDPTTPEALGNRMVVPRVIRDIYIIDHHAFIADCDFGFQVYDFSTPAMPIRIGLLDEDIVAYNLDVVGTFAYIAAYSDGLWIVDISNPAAPTTASVFPTTGDVLGIHVVGDYAYIAEFTFGLRIVDISDPYTPTEIGSYDRCRFATDVKVQDDYAYIANYEQGFKIVDVSDPSSPTGSGGINTTGLTSAIAISDDLLYVADDTEGLHVFDVSNPALPSEVAYFDPHFRASNVLVDDDYAYVSFCDDGLYILDVNYSPPLTLSLDPGWNIIAIPFAVPISSDFLPSTVIGDMYSYDPSTMGYTTTETLVAGNGYWVLNAEPNSVEFPEVTPIGTLYIELAPGWNLIGGTMTKLPSTILSDIEGIIPPLYEYNPESMGYFAADTIKPMIGYWVLTEDSILVELH